MKFLDMIYVSYIFLKCSFFKDCSVDINATQANGYQDDYWIMVPVTINDYNRNLIDFGGTLVNPVAYSLSNTALQVSC